MQQTDRQNALADAAFTLQYFNMNMNKTKILGSIVLSVTAAVAQLAHQTIPTYTTANSFSILSWRVLVEGCKSVSGCAPPKQVQNSSKWV